MNIGVVGPGVLKGPIRRDISHSVDEIREADPEVARELFEGSPDRSIAAVAF